MTVLLFHSDYIDISELKKIPNKQKNSSTQKQILRNSYIYANVGVHLHSLNLQ